MKTFRPFSRALTALALAFALTGCKSGGTHLDPTCPASILNAGLGNSHWPKLYGDAANRSLGAGTGPTTGSIRWSTSLGSQVGSPVMGQGPSRMIVPMGDQGLAVLDGQSMAWNLTAPVSSVPAIGDQDLIYLVTDDGQLRALESGAGIPQWTAQVPTPVGPALALSPIGQVITSSSQQISVFDSDGVPQWTHDLDSPLVGIPAMGPDGDLLLAEENGTLTALSPYGIPRWSYQAESSLAGTPVVDNQCTVYLVTKGETNNPSILIAVRPLGFERFRVALPGTASVDPILVPTGGVYTAATTEGTTTIWRITEKGTVVSLGESASPTSWVVDGSGKILMADINGRLSARNEPGAILWELDVGSAVTGSLALPGDGGVLLGTEDGRLIRVE